MTANYSDEQRNKKGFYTVAHLIDTIGVQNCILDEHSVLISNGTIIGQGNVFYPGVIIERAGEGALKIGSDNVFYPGTYIYGSHGNIVIGDKNEFGPAGVTIRANIPEVRIEIGNEGRYCEGANIVGNSTLGSGSQVIGPISVQSCTLANGGSSKEPDPDKRASVLKGYGRARGIKLAIGQVVNGSGDFADSPIETQRSYHPRVPKQS